jgi:hypothetical protein
LSMRESRAQKKSEGYSNFVWRFVRWQYNEPQFVKVDDVTVTTWNCFEAIEKD